MPTVLFRERLYPSLGVNLALALSAPMVYLAALPINPVLGVVLGVAVPSVLIVAANLLSPVITLDGDVLRVGKMQLPTSELGPAKVYSGEEARFERGPGLSPGSQRLFRGDIDKVVKIPVTDPDDPTEYVLFSCRRGEDLAVALGADRT